MAEYVVYPKDLTGRTNNFIQFAIKSVATNTSGGTTLNNVTTGAAVVGTIAAAQAAASANVGLGGIIGSAIAGAAFGAAVAQVGKGLTNNYQITPPLEDAHAYIKMYMPDTMNFSYDLSYEEDNLSNYKVPRYGALGGAIKGKLEDLLTGSSTDSLPGGILGLSILKEILPDGILPTDALIKGQGYAINPQVQLLFKAVGLRTFTMDFMFSPKNSDESNEVKRIVQLFRSSAAPGVGGAGAVQYTSDPNSSFFFVLPNIFSIQFQRNTSSGTSENSFIQKFKDCVLENVNVDYAPNGFSTFTDGSPTQIRLSLSFKETEIVTRDDILNSGY